MVPFIDSEVSVMMGEFEQDKVEGAEAQALIVGFVAMAQALQEMAERLKARDETVQVLLGVISANANVGDDEGEQLQ